MSREIWRSAAGVMVTGACPGIENMVSAFGCVGPKGKEGAPNSQVRPAGLTTTTSGARGRRGIAIRHGGHPSAVSPWIASENA